MKKLLLLLPVVALLAAACNSTQPVEQNQSAANGQQTQTTPPPDNNPAQATPPASSQATSTKIYTNATYGFSVQYPSEFSVKTSGTNGLALPEGTVNYLDRFALNVALFSLPKSSLPAGVTRADALVSVNSDIAGGNYFFRAVGVGIPPEVIDTLNLNTTVTISGIKYGMAIKDGAAAGTQSHVKVYHVYHNNKWYEIQLNVWTSSDGNGKQPNTASVEEKLQSVLAGFKFTK